LAIYLDTSVLAALFIETDVLAARAAIFYARTDDTLFVSDFGAAEFASVVARIHRMGMATTAKAHAIFASFDDWMAPFSKVVEIAPSDIQGAIAATRRLDLNLPAPDAIHLSIAQRLGGSIATFDQRMAENARILNIPLAAA
jgi:predicted nucleic acid-binding protein